MQDVNTHAWTGSVLVVSIGNQPPQFSVQHAGHTFTPQPVCLDSFQNYSFWRWQLDLQLLSEESRVDYSVSTPWVQGPPTEKRFSFTLPGQTQCWHWGFHSCNGFSQSKQLGSLPSQAIDKL